MVLIVRPSGFTKSSVKFGRSDGGGGGGIRTHDRITPILVFKTSALNRSATPPCQKPNGKGFGFVICFEVGSLIKSS